MRTIARPADARTGLPTLLAIDPAAHAAALRQLWGSAAEPGGRSACRWHAVRACRRTTRFVDRARAVGGYEARCDRSSMRSSTEGADRCAGPLAALMPARVAATSSAGAAFAPSRCLSTHRAGASAASTRRPTSRATWVWALPCRPTSPRACHNARKPGLPAAQRHRNVRDAFSATSGAREIRGEVVVLVDDVMHDRSDAGGVRSGTEECGVAEVRALTACARGATACLPV